MDRTTRSGIETLPTDPPDYVVRLPCNTNGHSPEIVYWLQEKFPPHTASKGLVCSYVYQEYWFVNSEDALDTWLTWGDYQG